MCPVPYRRNTFVLAGVVTAGISCGKADVPEVYMDVAKNKDWIDLKLKTLGIHFE